MIKKLISTFLTVLICLSAFCVIGVSAEDTAKYTEGYYTYTVENGEATIIRADCDSLANKVSIPAKLGKYPVTKIGDYAFYWCKNITNVTIPDSVETIGKYAFSNCTSLTGVTLPDEIDIIPEGAFFGCTALSRFVIPDSVTKIYGSAFYGCTELQNISFPRNLEEIGEYAFYNCSSLTSVSVPENTTTIGNAVFAMCENLTSAKLPANVSSLGRAVFYCCRKLTSVNLPENTTAIGEAMFYGCEDLKEITIPKNVTDIGEGTFYYCTAITEIEIPTAVTKIREYAFDGCENLAAVCYRGSQSDFDKIYTGSNNLSLENADKTFLYVTAFENNDGKYHISVFGVEGTPVVFAAFYQGTKFVDVQSDIYSPDGVTLGSDKSYDNVKIMVWDSYSSLKPITDVLIIQK
ncbi:MAG: leucine-rich repeat domain-containing protein [Clostridia bacterium]|nr:leucine-rich repeat domain-containing protein [Clostridia bacterium]